MTKIYYIGVCFFSKSPAENIMLTTPFQIIRNDPEPRQELCVEKDLSSFGYFTRNA
jgi:hypothetical protein